MSLLIEAERLRKKLEKLEQKKRDRLAEVAADYDAKIRAEKTRAGDEVCVLLDSAVNLGKAAE